MTEGVVSGRWAFGALAIAVLLLPMTVHAGHAPAVPTPTNVEFPAGHGPQFPGGTLTGDNILRFSGASLCLSSGVGCPASVEEITAGEGLAAVPNPIVGAGVMSLNINGGAHQICPAGEMVYRVSPTGIAGCANAVSRVVGGDGIVASAVDGTATVEVAHNEIDSEHIRNGAIRSIDVNNAQVQVRVDGACDGGGAIREITSLGNVECEQTPIVRAQLDLDVAGATDVGMVEVNSVVVTAPSDGFLVISGNAVVSNQDAVHRRMILVPKVDGEKIVPLASGAAASDVLAGNSDFAGRDTTLAYTVVHPIEAGVFLVSQDLGPSDSSTSFFHNQEYLTVQFMPNGGLSWRAS